MAAASVAAAAAAAAAGSKAYPTGGPPDRPTERSSFHSLGWAAPTGGGEHQLVARTWAAAADSDLLRAPLAVDYVFTTDLAGRSKRPTACSDHHRSQRLTHGVLASLFAVDVK